MFISFKFDLVSLIVQIEVIIMFGAGCHIQLRQNAIGRNECTEEKNGNADEMHTIVGVHSHFIQQNSIV